MLRRTVLCSLFSVASWVAGRGEEGDTPWAFFDDFEGPFYGCRVDFPAERQFDLVGYDENGIVFREDIAGKIQPEYERMVSRASREKLIAFFQDRDTPDYYYAAYLNPPTAHLPLVMLGTLLREFPADGRRIAASIFFNTPATDGIPSFFGRDTKYSRWPTLHRACFYFLLKAQTPETEKGFLAKVKESSRCVLATVDALLLEKASSLECDYFRKHGEWPDPAEVPGCLCLGRAKKAAGAAAVGKFAAHYALDAESLFPDLPVFWCLKTWQDEVLVSAFVRLTADAKIPLWCLELSVSWQEYGYRWLSLHRRIEEFRKLAKSDGLTAQVFGCAGVVDCLAQEGRVDREILDAAFGRVVEGQAVGEKVLHFLGYVWREVYWKRFLEQHAEEWVALCGGVLKPPRVLLRVAAVATDACLYAHPLDAMPGVDTAILKHIDQAIEGEGWKIECFPGDYYWPSDYIEVLCSTRTASAFTWLNSRLGSLPPKLRVAAIHACRHFGRAKLAELSKDMVGWGEAEKKALLETTTAVDCMEKAQHIVAQYREKRLSLNEALLGVSALRHAAVLPWIWELVRGHLGDLAPEVRVKVAQAINASTRPADYSAEATLRGCLRLEGFE